MFLASIFKICKLYDVSDISHLGNMDFRIQYSKNMLKIMYVSTNHYKIHVPFYCFVFNLRPVYNTEMRFGIKCLPI